MFNIKIFYKNTNINNERDYTQTGYALTIDTNHLHLYNTYLFKNDYIWKGVPLRIHKKSDIPHMIISELKLSMISFLVNIHLFTSKLPPLKNEDITFDIISSTLTDIDAPAHFTLDFYLKSTYVSANVRMNLYKLPTDIMETRLIHPNVGFFDTPATGIKCRKYITGCNNMSYIVRHNLSKAPWIYTIDSISFSISEANAIKAGVLSWNILFEYIGLGSPIVAKIAPLNPEDTYSMDGWKIINTTSSSLAVSNFTYDPRSGENLYGHIVFNMPKIYKFIEECKYYTNKINAFSLERFLSFVSAHESGHSLGFRHNFFTSITIDSVMGYYDMIFMPIPDVTDVTTLGRTYDINVLMYGYLSMTQQEATKMADAFTHSYGTDINLYENNPLIVSFVNDRDIFQFVNTAITAYKTYRHNILESVKSGKLTYQEYTTLYLELYRVKYLRLFKICVKFIGGYVYATHLVAINKRTCLRALDMLLTILHQFSYISNEQKYLIDSTGEIYSMKKINMYTIKHTLLQRCFKMLLNKTRIT